MQWNTIISSSLETALGAATIIYALAAIGLNVHFGYTGLLNFGQAGFMAVGAYVLAMIVATYGLSFWLGIGVGLLAAVLLALLLGIPTLRLRAHYLAIVTIAAAEIIHLLLRSVALHKWTGGSDGLQNFADSFYRLNPYSTGLNIGPISFDVRQTWVITVGWVLVAVVSGLVFLLMRSPWGRILKAIREDEDAVRSLGKNVFSYKIQSLIVGGVIGALAGFMVALNNVAVQPDLYGTETTFFAYTVLILGGAARIFGPIVGAAIFWFIIQFTEVFLSELLRNDYLPHWLISSQQQIGAVRLMLVGLGLMLLLIYRPQGIFGDKREIALDAR